MEETEGMPSGVLGEQTLKQTLGSSLWATHSEEPTASRHFFPSQVCHSLSVTSGVF